MNPKALTVNKYTLSHTMEYKDTPIFSYDINYPGFVSPQEERLDYLNDYYEEKAHLFQAFTKKNLFPLAMEQYHFATQHQYPIMKYEAVQNYTITDNRHPILSLYYDQYQYTGGAHGNTVRYSNVWNLDKKSTMQLKDFFPGNPGYRQEITNAVESYIAADLATDSFAYFDNYKQNVSKEFNENNFYVTPDGIVVYFQQYDIAPYSSGIPQFLIPFQK